MSPLPPASSRRAHFHLFAEFAARRSYAGTLVVVWACIVAGAIGAGSDIVEVLTIVGMVELLRIDQVVLLHW